MFGLFLLIMMHPAARRTLAGNAQARASMVAGAYFSLSARNAILAQWNAAFRMIFRDRRDLIIIVVALVVFDYAQGFLTQAISDRFVTPLHESYKASDPRIQSQYMIFNYGSTFIRYAGYALLGWLAFRRVQGADYAAASSFWPVRRVAGLLLMLFAVDSLSALLAPWSIRLFLSQELRFAFIMAAGTFATGALPWLVGARLFNEQLNGGISVPVIRATIGAVALSSAIFWLFSLFYELSLMASRFTPMWLAAAEDFGFDFTRGLLLQLIAVGFSVALAAPASRSVT